jgi:hypothetical protein
MAQDHILTDEEAAAYLRTETTDAAMLNILPMVDAFVLKATGRDWSQDNLINALAKAAAGMLLVQWYDNPGMGAVQGADSGVLSYGLTNVLAQLESEALKYRKYQFEGLNGTGSISLPGAREGDAVMKLRGVYGVSGDQSTSFASSVAEEELLVQTSASDLSEKIFVVILKNPADDITA